MADTFDILRKLALQVRNATLAGENSAERVGRIFVGVLDLLSQFSLDELTKIFLRKDQPDQTSFLVSFLAGAVFGKEGFASGLTGFGAKSTRKVTAKWKALFSVDFLKFQSYAITGSLSHSVISGMLREQALSSK